MTKTTAHSACQHPRTKAARALCRKTKNTVQTVTTEHGTFEIKVIKAKDLKRSDSVLIRPKNLLPIFTSPTYDAYQTERVNRQTGAIEKTDIYNINLGHTTYVSGDTEYTVAVDPKAVRKARHEFMKNLMNSFRTLSA